MLSRGEQVLCVLNRSSFFALSLCPLTAVIVIVIVVGHGLPTTSINITIHITITINSDIRALIL